MKKTLFTFWSALLATLGTIAGGEAKTPLEIMSSNIRFNSKTDLNELSWDSRKGPYAAMVRDIKPDVIGMQEPRDEQIDDLRELLPEYDRFRVVPTAGISRKQAAGGMILWRKERFERLDAGYFWLGPTPDKPCIPWDATDKYHYRMAIWVKLQEKASGKVLYLFSTHLPYDPSNRPDCFDADGNKIRNVEQRTRCAELIVERMRQIAGPRATIFVVGDMNCSSAPDDPTRPSLAPFYSWMESGREDAPEADKSYSFNGFGKSPERDSWNIDHIFFRRAKPLRFRTITSPDYGVTYISDHYPIVLSVEF